MTDQTEEILWAQAHIGDKADEWWNSELGKYIIGCSIRETEGYLKELSEVDPEDSKKIRKLQTNKKIAEKALVWINQAIVEGRQADQQLEAMEDLENG